MIPRGKASRAVRAVPALRTPEPNNPLVSIRAEPLDESGASCNRSDESIFLGEKRIASRNIASRDILCRFADPVDGARAVRNRTGTILTLLMMTMIRIRNLNLSFDGRSIMMLLVF